jgi:hypothetical protein
MDATWLDQCDTPIHADEPTCVTELLALELALVGGGSGDVLVI